MSTALVKPNGVRAVREAHGLTKVELATRAGVHPAYIAHIERQYPVGWSRLARTADSLGVSADELLGRVPPAPALDTLSRADRQLLDAMKRDAENLFGPELLARVGGWRKIARLGWLGYLIGRRDAQLERPPLDAPPVVAPSNPMRRRFPGRA